MLPASNHRPRASAVIVAFVLLVILGGLWAQSWRPHAQSPVASGYYLATSYSDLGRVAWLFSFDVHSGRGMVMDPSGHRSELRGLSTARCPGCLDFKFVDGDGHKMVFSGSRNGRGISGALGPPNSSSGTSVVLVPVGPPYEPARVGGRIAGLYSNMFIANGELGGYDLLLLQTRWGPKGFLARYEGEREQSWALACASLSGRHLSFRVEGPPSDWLVSVELTARDAVLTCRTAPPDSRNCFFGTSRQVLKKRETLWQLLPLSRPEK